MILMATRPIKDYNVLFIEKFRSIGSSIEIALNGLGEYEIGEIILQYFDSGVDRISPEIVKVVQVSSIPLLHKVNILTNLIETYWWKPFICQVSAQVCRGFIELIVFIGIWPLS